MTLTIILSLLGASVFFNILLLFKGKDVELKTKIEDLIVNATSLENALNSSISNVNKLISDNTSLRKKIESLTKEKNELVYTNPGDKVLFDVSLTRNSGKITFKVLYECNVLEITPKRVKIQPIDFTSDDKWTRENVQHYQEVLNFYKDKWVDRSECDIIIENNHTRDAKLKEVLDEN